MRFHQIDHNHFYVESESQTLVTYDLRLEEHGWTCSCPQNVYHNTCKHVDALVLQLNGPQPITPPRLAVRRAQANGDDLVSIFNYASTYQPTNHAKVVVRLDRRPIVCGRCGTENPPEAQVCKNCANLPVEAAMTRSA